MNGVLRVVLAVGCLACVAALLGGCQKPDPLVKCVATAVSPSGGRAAAAGMLAKAWRAGDLKLDDAINLSYEYLESAKNKTPLKGSTVVVPSANATAFAGAVLDAIEMVQDKLPQGGEFEIMWFRIGGLAFASAEEAHAAGRLLEARSLVFAGGKRWQIEGYWLGHTGHDGLASVILAKSGERAEAIGRLRDRGQLEGVAAEVYEMLQKGQ
ncbi:MAG: hypothetical protein WC718_11770 [Phycisphaerales bacterium]|jgi:hypothetical protein